VTRSAWLFSLSMLASMAAACSTAPTDRTEGRARALQARLMAPCCWQQTLDVHESPTTPGLRAEIVRRLRAGESTDAIEYDFVARYGERVLAVPHGAMLPEAVATPVVLLFLLGSGVVIARLVRRRSAQAPASSTAPLRDDLDRRLDEELDQVD
jgi:cytochrome c-type biogenesis protein CcmH